MKRNIKALIYQKPIQEFKEKFPGLLHNAKLPQTDKPLSELVDLTSMPRERLLMDNLLPLLETPPAQRIAILEALTRIHNMDVDKDYEAVTRHAMPIFDWIAAKKDSLREVISVPYSGNPYIYRQLWAFTFTPNNDDNCRAGVEAYTLSYPLEATMVQFTDGYDPVRYQFYEPLGELFEELVTLIAEGLESSIVVDQTYQVPQKENANPINLQQNKAGAKSIKQYDKAFTRLLRDEDVKEVFKQYLEESNFERSDKKTRDAFKSAMKRRSDKMIKLCEEGRKRMASGATQQEVIDGILNELGIPAEDVDEKIHQKLLGYLNMK